MLTAFSTSSDFEEVHVMTDEFVVVIIKIGGMNKII